MGLLTLAAQLTHAAAPGLPHLRTLNPYVGSVLNAAAAANSHNPLAAANMPRQPCGMPSSAAASLNGGVSSFAFQGTNAHAVLSAAAQPRTPTQTDSLMLQQQRYWVLPRAHPLLTSAVCSPSSVIMQCSLAEPGLAFLLDHQVLGRALFPAAGMLELAAAAASALMHDQPPSNSAVAAVTGLNISAPIVLVTRKQQASGTVLQTSVSPATGAMQVGCISTSGSATTVSATCTVSLATAQTGQPAVYAARQYIEVHALSCLLSELVQTSDSADAWTEGRTRRAGSKAGRGADAIGQVMLPEQAQLAGFLVPPQTLDSSLHLGVVAEGSGVKVPIAAGAFIVNQSASARSAYASSVMHAVAASQHDAAPTQAMTDFNLSGSGILTQHVSLSGLVTKVLSPAADQAASLSASGAMQLGQAQALYEVQSDCVSHPAEFQMPSMVHLRKGCCVGLLQGPGLLSIKAANAVDAASAVLQQLLTSQGNNQQQLQMLAEAPSQSLHGSPSAAQGMTAGVVSGLLRTAATEMASKSITLHTVNSNSSNLAMHGSLAQPSGFLNESSSTDSSLAQPQLVPSSLQASQTDLFQLSANPRGSLDNIAAMPFDKSSVRLQPHEVLVQVQAVGLNFRDVLNVLGMYPGDPGAPGADCSGIIMAVGSAAGDSLRPGVPVFGIAPGSLGTCVVTDSTNIAPVPPHVTFHEAASIPTVMLTAKAALLEAAKVSACSTVLVHAAAGGVGLAAIQVLQSIGATVIATAGSAQKRTLLHQLGVKHVISSRHIHFAAEIALLGGVDAVLNSMTSPGMVAASLAVLKPGGHFIEISKRGIWSQQQVYQNRPDCSFSYIAVDFLSPICVQSSLQWLAAALCKGDVKPLCSVNHSLGSATAAFRQMMQASHVGKVVINHPSTGMGAQSTAVGVAVAITGGLGGLGLLMAEWAVHQGASPTHLTLFGRTGRAKSGSALAPLLCSAASVTAHMLDASLQSDASCLGSHGSPHGPLGTVLHASGTLQDSMLQGQNPAALRAAFAPKVSAIAAMAPVLGCLPMQHIALFSSVASLLGTAGQANYAAANAGLDAWAASWEASGCVAKAVQWGAWESAGAV